MEILKILESVKSDLLSDEIKGKISTLFEATVTEKVNARIDELDKHFEDFKAKEMTKLEEKVVDYVDNYLVNKVNDYIKYVAEEYFKENALAVESGLKAELYDNLVVGMKKVMSENQIREEKVEEAETVYDENQELKSQLNARIEESIQLKKSMTKMNAERAFEEATTGLSVEDTSKLRKLVEEFDIDNTEEFKKKILIVKESLTSNSTTTVTEEKKELEKKELVNEEFKIKVDVEPYEFANATFSGMTQYL